MGNSCLVLRIRKGPGNKGESLIFLIYLKIGLYTFLLLTFIKNIHEQPMPRTRIKAS
jgi:hypothetical protein